MSLKRYSNYRDTGVEWLREIPAGWRSASLGSLTQIVNGGTPTPAEENWGGDVAWATPADMSAIDGHRIESTGRTLTETGLQTGSSRVPEGSVLLSTRAPIGYSVLADRPFAFNQGCKALVPGQFLSSVYLLYALQAAKAELSSRGQGTTFLELSTNALSAVRLPVPTIQEQATIASFLDRETAEIDAFIAEQAELIALLVERRAATISHAVAKGLDPSAPMKDSGVDWLGEVPEHWIVTRLSRKFSVTLGKMLDAGRAVNAEAVDRPYIRAANIQSDGLHLADVNTMPFTGHELRQLSLKAGDLLVTEGGASVGANVVLRESMHEWGFQKTVNRVRPLGDDLAAFVGFLIDSMRERGVVAMIAMGSTFAHLTAEKLERLQVAFPPDSEQQSIVHALNSEVAMIEAAVADAREAIALSKERRAALISAAVTGKIDVRNHGGVE